MQLKHLLFILGFLASPVCANDAPSLSQRIETVQHAQSPNTFELGFYRSLQSLEKLFQAEYRYDLFRDQFDLFFQLRGSGTTNPTPDPFTPETITIITQQFLDDLASARLALGDHDDVTPFTVDLSTLWFDVNENGQQDQNEWVIDILGGTILGPRQYDIGREATKTPVIVRMDAADLYWLRAYTHVLSGIGSAVLAFDPAPVIRDLLAGKRDLINAPTIPNTFDSDALMARLQELESQLVPIKRDLDQIEEQMGAIMQSLRSLNSKVDTETDATKKEILQNQIAVIGENRTILGDQENSLSLDLIFIQAEMRAIQSKLYPQPSMFASFDASVEVFYAMVKSLAQSPDPIRIKAIRTHWQSMIDDNKRFWAELAQETDNYHEWIANSRQNSVIGIDVTDQIANAWQLILADVDAVLNGRLLVPHPLLPQGMGINLAAYFDDPAALGIVDLISGVGLIPYVAKGPTIDSISWAQFQRVTRGDGASFAIILN